MQRRALLRRGAVLGAFSLAGCVANGDDGNGGEGGDGGNSTGTSTPPDEVTNTPEVSTGTSPAPTAVERTSIETMKTGCASGNAGTATVAFDAEAMQVDIDGVLSAATPCHVASLADVTYDGDHGFAHGDRGRD